MSPPSSDARMALGRIGIVITVLAWIAYVFSSFFTEIINNGYQGNVRFLMETIGYVLITSSLALSALLYLVARQGALYRTRAHRRVPRAVIDECFDTTLPTMTVLVPSYREEVSIVRKTLLSAALQEYPFLRVVLLLDDPPNPTAPEHIATLAAGRALSAELTEWLSEPKERFTTSLERYETSGQNEPIASQILALAAEYRWAANWLRKRSDEEIIVDHVDRFFADRVLGVLSADFAEVSVALVTAAGSDAQIPLDRMMQLHRRLAWTFRSELTWFERKQYASLSQESNKAMNLNSYIGLMGHSFEVRQTPEGQILAPSGNTGTLAVPDADYLLTLDADSVILPEYCLRLVYVMSQPENARLAVIQTPYSAFPGSSTRMERLSGATTDLQHIVHQGMSYYGSTFWVGANAVIRKRALDDIVQVEHQGGFEIRRYVMDRTVIEDTESSLDLAIHGWSLLNYPERLSYSATPPDFGSLSIQRRRWANGGLLIMPKLWALRRARIGRAENGSSIATLLRVNYLASTCWSSVALVFLLVYPFDSKLLSPLVLLAAAPYFLAMSSDLKRCGYKRADIFRVYGFNLILLPVNLAGVAKSIQQAITGRSIPFARTPKVSNRTATGLLFALSPFLIIGYSVFTVYRDVKIGNWGNAAFAAFNAATASYALVALMGVQNAIVDIWLGFVERLYVPEKSAKPVVRDRQRRATPVASGPSWEDVLYRGAAATATGEHVSAGTGMFRILATPPPAAVRHNRRASDRSGGAHNRRASDRAGSANDRAGSAADRAGDAGDRAGGASDRAGGANDRAGSAADRAGSANDRTGSSTDRATKGSE